MRRLVSVDEATPAEGQHTKPCSDCPWSRRALPGWLGGLTPKDWVRQAHSDVRIDCHTLKGAECAGASIYRRNVCKEATGATIRLEADRERVFANPMQFVTHHEQNPAEFLKREDGE